MRELRTDIAGWRIGFFAYIYDLQFKNIRNEKFISKIQSWFGS